MLNEATVRGVLPILAILFGIAWSVTNIYTYFPVVRATLDRLRTGLGTTEAAFVGTQRIDETELTEFPDIDVFVPGYDEAEVIHQSIQSIRETAYPQERITLTVLLEPDDTETIARVESLAETFELDLITVPSSYPGSPNKPRALNYGFEKTNADIVGVIDAENIVSPDLFDRVAKAVAVEDRDYVQGIVDMANEDDGWKNLLFRAEYGYWYRFIVPAFRRIGFPIPLSGTTCFFKREVLETVAAERRERKGSPWTSNDESWLAGHDLAGITPWDPKNVTEDFELGLHLWLTDHEFGLIETVTKEESPQTLTNWLKQRTRWQKGKLFTFFDYLRNPAGSSKQRGHLLWQSFLPHVGPLNIIGISLLVVVGTAVQFIPDSSVVVGILRLSSLFLLMGVLSFGVGYWRASTKPSGTKLLRAVLVAITAPAYWILQWGADVRAFKQLSVGDLDWEKTVHEDSGRFETLHGDGDDVSNSLRSVGHQLLRRHMALYPILGLAVALRLPRLARSLWLDEAYSVIIRSSETVFGVITTVEPHPPGYYLLLHFWMKLFGQSELAVRSLSLLIGLGGIAAAYALGSHLYDQNTGLVTALIMTVSTLHIQYSQMARMYGLMVMLTAVSCYFYFRLLRSSSLETQFGYGVATLALLYTHVYGGLILLAQFLHLGIYTWQNRRHPETITSAGRVLKTSVVTGFLFVPWVAGMLVPNFILTSEDTPTEWLDVPDVVMLRDILYSYGGIPVNYPTIQYNGLQNLTGRLLIGGFALGVVYLLAHSSIKLLPIPEIVKSIDSDEEIFTDGGGDAANAVLPAIKSHGGLWMALSLMVSTIAVPYVFSHLAFPILNIRYAIAGFVGFALILSRATMSLPSQKLRVGAVLLLLLMSAPATAAYYETETREDWKEAGARLNAESISSDHLIIYSPNAELPLSYYLSEESQQSATNITYRNDSQVSRTLSEGEFTTVWVVDYNNLGSVQRVTDSAYKLVSVSRHGQNIALKKYTRVNASED